MMRLRQKKKICEEDVEKDERAKQKKRKVLEMNKAAPTRQSARVAAGGFGGPSPAKKPRTNRPRVAGAKLPHFLLDETEEVKKGKDGKNNKQQDDDNYDYDFNNVVKAVALTLAEASQNGSDSEGPSCKEKANGKANESSSVSDDEVGNEFVKSKSRRGSDAAELGDNDTNGMKGDKNTNGIKRRPPSKRIRNQREKELAEEEMGAVEAQKTRFLPQRSKKRSRQLFSGDEVSGLDTLATLADLSLSGLLPSPSDSDRGGDGSAPGELQELVSQVLSLQVERGPVKKEQELKEHNTRSKSSSSPRKKKRSVGAKASGEASSSGKVDDKAHPFAYKPHGRTKRISTLKKHSKHDDEDGVNYDVRSKKRTTSNKGSRSELDHCPHTTAEIGPFSTKARLLHCLSIPKVRQWCVYEWFYSAIDLPWFATNDFVEYLNHAGLGHVSKLTRAEWGVIRNSLGKPRRLSQKFMVEEREKLASYRETVRAQYCELRNDKSGCCLPPDLARPLTVGQRVIARHPKTGDIYDGNILTVDRNRCRVQFDRTELGVEFVLDVNAMPVNPLENMSENMRKRRIIDFTGSGRGGRSALSDRLDRPGPYATPSQFFLSTLCHRAQMDNVDSVLLAKAAASEAVAAVQQAGHGHPSSSIQAQAREADICALAELSRQLDKKEALLVELRRMNDEADKSAGEAEPLRSSEAFKRQYATVVLQLKDVNKQVSAALVQLRERNRYQENLVPPWHSPPPCSVEAATAGLGAGSPAEEITLTARKEARSMVSATIQAICCLKEGEDALLGKLGKTHNIDDGQLGKEGLATSNIQPQVSDKSDSLLQHAGTDKQKKQSAAAFANELKAFIPKEYIASCIATVLMIQMCAEKYHLPHSDVAVMFENALANLRPRSAQNHQLYKEVEQLFDVLKNQVTAEVSFRSNMSLPVDCFFK